MPPQRPCALAQHHPLPHTPCPTPPGSASVRPATPGLRPALLPGASGRWPARSLHPTLQAKPPPAGRAGGSAGSVPDVAPVAALLLSPGAHPPHAARLPFHTEGRDPDQSSCVQRSPSRHSGRPVPTLLSGHNACTAATKSAHGFVEGLTSLPRLEPLRA